MSTEIPLNFCPRCQSNIQPDAPGGLCPKCLMEFVAFSTSATNSSAADANTSPNIDSIRSAFPNLEIIELVGQGGMGAVFKARQKKLDRIVALKILPATLALMPQFADRFEREGRLLAKLNHPNIIAVYDFGEQQGFYYLLMEFVDGVNLRQALSSSRFSPEQALSIIPRICDALQFAHDQGVLHRDIKPENILLDSMGRIKIADFGIAKFVGGEQQTGLTATGATVGTPHYMAPEQLEHPSDVDHRADIYSLGVVFYEMLTGELPIGRFPAPSDNRSMDGRIDSVVLRALEKNRERRQQSANEVRTQVESICTVPPQLDRPQYHPQLAGTKGMVWNSRAYVALIAVIISILYSLSLMGTIGIPTDAAAKIVLAITGCIGLPGTMLAWLHLNQVRKSGIQGGRIPALIASILLPVVAVGTLTFSMAIFIGQNFLKNVSTTPDEIWLGSFFAMLMFTIYVVGRFVWSWTKRGPVDPNFLVGYRSRYFSVMPAFVIAVTIWALVGFLLLNRLDEYANWAKSRVSGLPQSLVVLRTSTQPEIVISDLATIENVLVMTLLAQNVPSEFSVEFTGNKLMPPSANLASQNYTDLCFFPGEQRNIVLRFTELDRERKIAFAFPDAETAVACKNKIERHARAVEEQPYSRRLKLFEVDSGVSYSGWIVPHGFEMNSSGNDMVLPFVQTLEPPVDPSRVPDPKSPPQLQNE